MMKYLLSIGAMLLFLGCASHTVKDVKPREYHTNVKSNDSLYYLASDNVAQHAGKTGFYPLAHYYDAFIARLELIKAAKKTIDMQYFIFSNDEVSTAFMDEVIKAADRGVKVRILVDDLLLK